MSDAPLPELRWPVDRARAAVRATWRVGVSLPLLLVAYRTARDARWDLMWLQDRAAWLGYAVLLAVLFIAVLPLLVSAIRWLLLVAWPSPMQVQVTPARISLALGPLGRRDYDWPHIRVRLADDLDPALLDDLPPEHVAVTLRHPQTPEEIGAMIVRFTSLDTDRLWIALRPYVKRALGSAS